MTVYTTLPTSDLNLAVEVTESNDMVTLNITPASVNITSAVTSVNGLTGNVILTTTEITEGVNEYFTDARADARVDLQTGANLDLSYSDTDDLAEGPTNLYYTTARDSAQFDTDFGTKTTTDLTEGSNLYYTDARAQTVITANTEAFIKADSTDTLTNKSGSNLQWTNDAGYITSQTDDQTLSFTTPDLTISNGNSVDLSTLTNGFITASSTDTLTNKSGAISQWTNDSAYLTSSALTPYYTSTQVDALPVSTFTNDAGYSTSTGTVTPSSTDTFTNKSGAISQWTNDSAYLTSAPVDSVNGATGVVVLDTDDITEAGNLYYTDTRSRNAISLTADTSSLTYNNTTGVFTYTDPTGSPGPASHLEIAVRNTTGVTIPANSAVYISGVSGNNDLIELAVNTGTNPAMGVTTSSINNNSNGVMIIGGEIGSFDTSAYNENDTLYLSNTSGELTNTRPGAETSFVQNVGRVVRSGNNGTIIIQGAGRANDIPNLDSLHVFIGDTTAPERRQLTVTDILNTDTLTDGGTY